MVPKSGFVTDLAKLLRCFVLGGALATTLGCESAPEEPVSDSPAMRPSAPTLTWTAPPTWNVVRVAQSGEYRAKYEIGASGDGKHKAELLVSNIGSKSVDDPLRRLLADFEGPGVDDVARKEMAVGAFTVKTMEVGATYKFPMGPRVGPDKKAPVQALKKNWRAIGAGVETEDRGNWYFQLVGPSDTVEAARSAFIAMLQGVK